MKDDQQRPLAEIPDPLRTRQLKPVMVLSCLVLCLFAAMPPLSE